MPPRIFISYRREGSSGYARSLFNELSAIYDRKNIFFDRETIPAGEDFDSCIIENIQQSDIFLAVLADNTFARIHDKDDWVRKEIAYALTLRGKGLELIPIFIGSFDISKQQNLPEDIQNIVKIEGRKLHDDMYSESVKRITDEIDDILYRKKLSAYSSNAIGVYEPVPVQKKPKQGKELFGKVGELVDDAWEINIATAAGACIYGPYIQLKSGSYQVIFRMKVDNNRPIKNFLFVMEIKKDINQDVLGYRGVWTHDFVTKDTYQDFVLPFQIKQTTDDIEFRLRATPNNNGLQKIVTLKHVRLEKL